MFGYAPRVTLHNLWPDVTLRSSEKDVAFQHSFYHVLVPLAAFLENEMAASPVDG